MYLVGKIEIDPSQATEIAKVKPTSFFGKLLDVMSFGKASGKVEKETFSALSILEQIYAGLRTSKVDNIIRLAVDDYDFYYDDSGQEADMADAISQFTTKVDPLESELFETLYLVMEHSLAPLKLLIEIRINRKHNVGEYPISIFVNGVIDEYKTSDDTNLTQLKTKLKNVFAEQKEYDDFIDRHKRIFDSFMHQLEYAVRKYIEVDDVRVESKMQVIRPKKKIANKVEIKHNKRSKPAYYGYYGFDDYFFYAWLWGDMMHDYNIYTHSIDVVDEQGNEIAHIGNSGFNAGDSNMLNSDAPFEPVSGSDIEYFQDNEFDDDLQNGGINFENSDSDSSDFSDDTPDFDLGDD